jgi:uncharacterized protein RhaS with RHS repeats
LTHSPHQPKLASGHTQNRPGERVFVIAPLAANPRPANAHRYGGIASGATYLESDPIGLASGNPSTYGYANGNPLSYTDPFGLDVTVTLYDAAHGFGHIGTAVNSSVTQGLYPVQNGVAVVAGQDVAGIIKPDSEPVIASITIHTSPLQDVQIQAAIDRARRNPPKYNLYRNNCAQESASFLNAGGLNVPSDVLPKNYFQALQNLFKSTATAH